MANWSKKKPPFPRNPVNIYRVSDDAYVDKHMKRMSSTSVRQILEPLNIRNENAVALPSETVGIECVNMFRTEEVDALLNERFIGRKFDSKAKLEWMAGYVKKLKDCIKLFQKGLGELVVEKDNMIKMLESSERKSVESEAAMKSKEDKLSATIFSLEMYISSLKETLANEESAKLDALDCHKREKEAKLALEKNQDLLREELGRAKQSALNVNEKVKTLEDMYKRVQEYNTSLQQYNTKLQNELQAATGAKKQVEREKAVILENLSTLRVHHNLLRKEFTSAKITQGEVYKQKEAAVKKLP